MKMGRHRFILGITLIGTKDAPTHLTRKRRSEKFILIATLATRRLPL
jgi:hypothetical protein